MSDDKPERLPWIHPGDIREIPRNVRHIMGDCDACNGFGCDDCEDTGADGRMLYRVATEATRLLRRDIGRGACGPKAMYIGFAFDSLRESQEAA